MRDLLGQLPPYKGDVATIASNQSFGDIKKEVIRSHELYTRDYDKIANKFWAGSVRKTAQRLFDFCKRYFTYVEESDKAQTTRSPSAILHTANTWGVDCKHYAGFIAGVLDALQRMGYPIEWFYRFASYNMLDPIPGHVFVVVMDHGKEIFIDPVFSRLNEREPGYFYKQDKNVSMLSRVSGTGALNIIPVSSSTDRSKLLKQYGIVTLDKDGLPIVPAGSGTKSSNKGLFAIAGIGILFYLLSRKKK